MNKAVASADPLQDFTVVEGFQPADVAEFLLGDGEDSLNYSNILKIQAYSGH